MALMRADHVLLCVVAAGQLARASDEVTVALRARAIEPGEVVILTATTPAGVERVRVRAFDRDIHAFQVDDRTWRAVVGIDLAVRPGRYPASVSAAGPARTYESVTTLAVRPHAFPTRRLKVDDAFVNPPEHVTPRIQREARRLEDLWSESAFARLWSGAFRPPVPEKAVGRFGARSVFNGQPRSPHSGDDFPSPPGTPVLAPGGGRIALAGDLYFSGNTVVIDHGLGLLSLLAHLSSIDVRVDQVVTAGERVGLVGATGRVTGPHLHWAVRLNGARVDPGSLLASLGTGERQ
jgi:murein DD-endopeptidase MepM/ murein hydrolase activator NlpD